MKEVPERKLQLEVDFNSTLGGAGIKNTPAQWIYVRVRGENEEHQPWNYMGIAFMNVVEQNMLLVFCDMNGVHQITINIDAFLADEFNAVFRFKVTHIDGKE